jgi:hypothetical protein
MVGYRVAEVARESALARKLADRLSARPVSWPVGESARPLLMQSVLLLLVLVVKLLPKGLPPQLPGRSAERDAPCLGQRGGRSRERPAASPSPLLVLRAWYKPRPPSAQATACESKVVV